MRSTTRFAPSPTGPLHLGHAHAALFAAARGTRFLLRIEDIDAGRCRPEYVAAIARDLGWLGLKWEQPMRQQARHLPEYAAVLHTLQRRGLVYRCACTRAAIAREVAASGAAPHAPDGGPRYPGTCRGRGLASGAWRLDMARAVADAGPLSAMEDGVRRACDPAAFGDVVLGRADAPVSYHLCATHDDAAQGVTLVTRGYDLRPATDLHRLLQALMGWTEPAYAHHALLTDAAGRRLSKRDGAASIASLREAGLTPGQVRAMALPAQTAAPTIRVLPTS